MTASIRKLLATALLVHLFGCADPEESDDSIGDYSASDASDSVGASNEVCYFEYRASYSCSDGDGDPGVWEATCSAIAEDACGGGDFVGSSDYVDGCIFRTEFRSVQWIDADACEAMLPDAEPEPEPEPDPSSSTSGGPTGGDDGPAPADPYGSCWDGSCADPNAAFCINTTDGSANACAQSCSTFGSYTECPGSDSGTPAVCADNGSGDLMCVLECTNAGCPSGMSCFDASGNGTFAICLWGGT